MPDHPEYRRIAGFEDKSRMIEVLSAGNPGAMDVLHDMVEYFEGDIIPLLCFDSKHLYGTRIWQLYRDMCGGEMQRFVYHLDMELPCQICGRLLVSGPYCSELSEEELIAHVAAREGSFPESFWALASPPQTPFYEFPVKVRL